MMLPKSCSGRKSLQSSRRHVCRTTLLSYKRNLVTQQQESCQTVLSQRNRNWNWYRQGIHFCDSIYLPCSTFLSLVSIFCVPHLIPVGDSAGVTEYQAAELISQVWAHSALVLGPSHHCGPCSPGRRVMYTWLLFTSLEMLDRRPKTGFVSRSRHNISLWSGRIILWDSALGWHIHKLLGDLFFCKHTDMTQIILMQLRVKILGENTTPNHLPKKISCEAKYCTVVVVFFLPGYQQFASSLSLAPGKQRIQDYEHQDYMQFKAVPALSSVVERKSVRKWLVFSIGLDGVPGPSCMARCQLGCLQFLCSLEAATSHPAPQQAFRGLDGASPLLMGCVLVLMSFRALTTGRLGRCYFSN